MLHQQKIEAERRAELGLVSPMATTWIANTADSGGDKEEGAAAQKDAP